MDEDKKSSKFDFNRAGIVTEALVAVAMCVLIWGTFVSLSVLGEEFGNCSGIDILTSNYLLQAIKMSGSDDGGVTFLIYLLKGCIVVAFILLGAMAIFLLMRFFKKDVKPKFDCLISAIGLVVSLFLFICATYITAVLNEQGKELAGLASSSSTTIYAFIAALVAFGFQLPWLRSKISEKRYGGNVPAKNKWVYDPDWPKTRSVKLNKIGGIIAAAAFGVMAVYCLFGGYVYGFIILLVIECAVIAIFTALYCRHKSFNLYILKTVLPATLMVLYTTVRYIVWFVEYFYGGMLLRLVVFNILPLAVMWILTAIVLTKKEQAPKRLIMVTLIIAGISFGLAFFA